MYSRFLRLLEDNDMHVSDVVKGTGLSYSTFTDWKAGRYNPKKEKIQKIADYFGVPISYFYEDAEKPTYYLDEKTRETAEEIRTNKELKLLFDAARDASPEDLLTVHQMLLALKRKERHDD